MFESDRSVHHRTPSPAAGGGLVVAFAVALVTAAPAAAQQNEAVPPSPTGAARVAPPNLAPPAERCTGCHAQLTQQAVVHGALKNGDCRGCHEAAPGAAGKCRSKTAASWKLIRSEPELCYGCHARKDQSPSVHTAVRQGSCLSCHAAHASANAGLLTSPREKVCFDCHDADAIATKPVKHAPAAEGLCLGCHDPHGGDLPNAIKAASGNAFCLRCHDAKAPSGKGTPGPGYRIDLSKPFVHTALKRSDCTGCHDGGHSGDNLKLLKKSAVDLCYRCHERKDKAKYPHGAVLVGDCAVCHDPHSSDTPKLLAKPTIQANCFLCHQDDLTGRKVIHKPVAEGCNQCHDAHGAANRYALVAGEGKKACYACHKPMDAVKVKHAALERYGCTVCHDPHGAANGAMLGEPVNAICVGCHADHPDGKHVTPIAAAGHVVGGGLLDPRRPGRAFSCASCHNPHGSDNPNMFYLGENAMDSCDGCHGDKSGKRPGLKDVTPTARRTQPGASPSATGSAGAGGSGGGGSDVGSRGFGTALPENGR